MCGMHAISTLIGAAFPFLLSKTVTEIICVVLFLGFGVFMVYQALFDGEADVSLISVIMPCRRKNTKSKRSKRNSERPQDPLSKVIT